MLIMSLNTGIVLFLLVLMLKGNEGCFNESQTHIESLKKGNSFYKECNCSTPGYNVRHLKWFDTHNQEIDVLRPGTDQKAYIERQSDGSGISLYIPMMTKALSGLYRCVTNYEGQDYSQDYYIEAYEPVTINPPGEQYVLLGNRSLVNCKVHAEDPSKILISWTKVDDDDTRIPITNNDKYEITLEGLYINQVVDEDKGKYNCFVYDKPNTEEVDKDINVKISITPVIKDIKVIPGNIVVAGDILALHCIADGIPHPEYIWRRIDTNVLENPRWKTSANGIMIEPVLPEDQGKYECVAQSLAGVVTKAVDIQVYFPPKILSFPSHTAVEGSTVQLVCNAVGRPTPNISIIFIGQDEDEIKDFDENDIMENLSFLKLDRHHVGLYVCNASNAVNYTVEEMYITVEYKPRFEIKEETVWGWEGEAVTLSCLTESHPPPNFFWRYLGEDLPTSVQVEINEHLLHMNQPVSDAIHINVSAMSLPLYGTYECNATNHLGSDKKIIHFKEGHVPPLIRNASGIAIAPTSATFYIEDPGYFQGPTILGYIGEYDMLEKYNVTNIHLNRTWAVDRPFTIENLKPDTEYLIRFAAINLVGYSEWSDYMEFRTKEPSAPNPPVWEMTHELLVEDVINVTDADQKIAWKESDSNSGAPVDYYTLKYCPIDETTFCMEQKVLPNAELKADLNILDHNTTYFIELVAHNYIGSSEAANITITTPAKIIATIPRLSAGVLIGISVVVVFICLVILDLLLLLWKRQGIMAACCCRKKKNKVEDNVQTRDKKGLLKDSRDEAEKTDNRPKEYEYNKTTGIITGKHSAV